MHAKRNIRRDIPNSSRQSSSYIQCNYYSDTLLRFVFSYSSYGLGQLQRHLRHRSSPQTKRRLPNVDGRLHSIYSSINEAFRYLTTRQYGSRRRRRSLSSIWTQRRTKNYCSALRSYLSKNRKSETLFRYDDPQPITRFFKQHSRTIKKN